MSNPVNQIQANKTQLLLAAQAGSNSALGQLLQGYRDYLNLLADEELGPDITFSISAAVVGISLILTLWKMKSIHTSINTPV